MYYFSGVVMKFAKLQSSVQNLLFASLLALLWSTPVQAEKELTSAEVYKILKQVQLLQRKQTPRPAQLKDVLVPLDALRTGEESGANLLFNEGSLGIIGSKTTFRFKLDMRQGEVADGEISTETILEVRQGVAVVIVSPRSETTNVDTPQGTVDFAPQRSKQPTSDFTSQRSKQPTSQLEQLPPDVTKDFRGSVVAIIADDSNKNAIFLNLTPHRVVINNPQGTQSVTLQGGQTVAVNNGVIGEVQNFDLKKFYQTTKLAAVLDPEREDLVAKEPKAVQKTLRILRQEASLAIKAQERWVNGLCSLNSRASASTLSTNCITTGDDPIDNFEDVREVITPDPHPPQIYPSRPNIPQGNLTTIPLQGQPNNIRQSTTPPPTPPQRITPPQTPPIP